MLVAMKKLRGRVCLDQLVPHLSFLEFVLPKSWGERKGDTGGVALRRKACENCVWQRQDWQQAGHARDVCRAVLSGHNNV